MADLRGLNMDQRQMARDAVGEVLEERGRRRMARQASQGALDDLPIMQGAFAAVARVVRGFTE